MQRPTDSERAGHHLLPLEIPLNRAPDPAEPFSSPQAERLFQPLFINSKRASRVSVLHRGSARRR